jgi:hypothetical protein
MNAEPIPRRSFDVGKIVQQLLMAAMVVAFVFYGIRGLKMARSRRTEGTGVLNSSDAFLQQALQVDGGGEKILAAISDMPPLQPLAIVVPNDNVFGSILLLTIASFAWPHEIYLIHAGNADVGKVVDTLRNDHFAGALFYNVAPPVPGPHDRRVGLLTIVPISK